VHCARTALLASARGDTARICGVGRWLGLPAFQRMLDTKPNATLWIHNPGEKTAQSMPASLQSWSVRLVKERFERDAVPASRGIALPVLTALGALQMLDCYHG
jgi:hypothetical protein